MGTYAAPDAVERVRKIKQGNPLDTETMIGAQASNDQVEKILSYIGFSLEAPEGVRFLIRSRLFTESERAALAGG